MKLLISRTLSVVLSLSLTTAGLYAQRSLPDVVQAQRISEKIVFDGRLSDPAWETAPRITNFIQREPDFGQPSSQQTEVVQPGTRRCSTIQFIPSCYYDRCF